MVYRQSENHARLSYKVYIQNIHKNHPTSGLKSEKIKPDFMIKDPPDYKVYTWSHLTSGLQCEIMLDTLMKPLTKVSHKIPLQVVHRQYEYQVIIVTHTTLQ